MPNILHDECIAAGSTKGLGGLISGKKVPGMFWRMENAKPEKEVFEYQIEMINELQASETVTVLVTSNDPRCTLVEQTFVFSSSNWNVAVPVGVELAEDSLFLAKDSRIYTCLITHSLSSSINTVYASRVLTLNAESNGCGEGEYLGVKERGKGFLLPSVQSKCICLRGYYMPKQHEMLCMKCPSVKSSCPRIGMVVPITMKGWWRSDMLDPNITKFKFYKCEKDRCTGSNNTNTSCVEGYDEQGPKCNTCAPNFSVSYLVATRQNPLLQYLVLYHTNLFFHPHDFSFYDFFL